MLIEHNHIKYVIFDFANTNFMDSSGIGVLWEDISWSI